MIISAVISRYFRILGKGLAFVGKYSIVILCVHIVELEAFPWGDIVNILIDHGVSEYIATAILLRLFKILWIAAATIFCHFIAPLRKKFLGLKSTVGNRYEKNNKRAVQR